MERKFIAEPNYNSLTILYTYSTWFSLALNWLTSWLELVNVFCKWMNIVCNNLIPPQNFGQIQDEHLILNWFHRWNDNGGHKIHRIKLFFSARFLEIDGNYLYCHLKIVTVEIFFLNHCPRFNNFPNCSIFFLQKYFAVLLLLSNKCVWFLFSLCCCCFICHRNTTKTLI